MTTRCSFNSPARSGRAILALPLRGKNALAFLILIRKPVQQRQSAINRTGDLNKAESDQQITLIGSLSSQPMMFLQTMTARFSNAWKDANATCGVAIRFFAWRRG